MSNKETQQPIRQLQQLQIQQREITHRLATIAVNTSNNTREREKITHVAGTATEPPPVILQVGDRVRIKTLDPTKRELG